MNVEKIVTKKEAKKLAFSKITLLSIEEYQLSQKKISTTKEEWWLRSPDYFAYHDDTVWGVEGAAHDADDGDVNEWFVKAELGVRPALKIQNLNNSEFNVGDHFKLGEKDWTIISSDYALCDNIIGFSCFNNTRKNNTRKNNIKQNEYETSDVKNFIESWAEENHIEFVPELQSEADRTTEEKNTNQSDKASAISQKFTLKIINTRFSNQEDREVLSTLWVYPPTDIEQVYRHAAEIYKKAKQHDLRNRLHNNICKNATRRMAFDCPNQSSLVGCVYYKLYDESEKIVKWADDAMTKIRDYAKEIDEKEILSDEHKFPFKEYPLDQEMSLFEWEAKEDKNLQLWDESAPDIKELKEFWRSHLETGREGYDNDHEWFAISNLKTKDFEKVIRLAKQADEVGYKYRTVNFYISDTGSCYFAANTSHRMSGEVLRDMIREGNFYYSPTYYQKWDQNWDNPSVPKLSYTDCELTTFGVKPYDYEDMEEYIDSYGDTLLYDICFVVRDNSTGAVFDFSTECNEKEQVEDLIYIAYKLPLAADYEIYEITAEDKKTTLDSLLCWMREKESEFESALEEYEKEDDE